MTDLRPPTPGIRRQNLSAILTRIHRGGPISRAKLTESTGLNRSTVADLVSELAGGGLVFESPPGQHASVGRPSPVVTGAADCVVISVHPEVDGVEVAAIGLDRSVVARESIEVERKIGPEECALLVGEVVACWREGVLSRARLVGVGVAVPGIVRVADGVVREAPRLGWINAPLRALLAEHTGLPVAVRNDANLGLLAESRFGAARSVEDAVYLNGGASGIGGALLVGGVLVGGADGYAGELGKMLVGGAGQAGDGPVPLELGVSRAELLASAGMVTASDEELRLALDREGSSERAAVRQQGLLVEALAEMVNLLNPEVVVLGGFLPLLAFGDFGGLRDLVRERAVGAAGQRLEVRPAVLAGDRLLVGAAEVAFQPLIEDPLGVAPRIDSGV